MADLIESIEKTGLFRFCGKCAMCLKYYNPEDPPEPDTGYFSNPNIRGQYLLSPEMRKTRKDMVIQTIKPLEKLKKSSTTEDLYEDEYFLSCSMAQTQNYGHIYASYFISNYGRIGNIGSQPPLYHIINNQFMYNHVGEQILRYHKLTQEYFNILNNLLFWGKLIINDRDNHNKYDENLIFMIVSNYNLYRQKGIEIDDEIDEVIDRLETPISELPSPIKSSKRTGGSKETLRKIGSKKKKRKKTKRKSKKNHLHN